MQLDLADMQNVDKFCQSLQAAPDLDVLVGNAGLMTPVERQVTKDGYEAQLQVRSGWLHDVVQALSCARL
jgi:NADP-dependent 3-hydroxy acid dehydrogenase YdfG